MTSPQKIAITVTAIATSLVVAAGVCYKKRQIDRLPPGLLAEITASDTVAVAVREFLNTMAAATAARISVESAIAAANDETKTNETAIKEVRIMRAALATAIKEVLEKKAVYLEKDAALLEIQAKNAAWKAKEAENTARAATNTETKTKAEQIAKTAKEETKTAKKRAIEQKVMAQKTIKEAKIYLHKSQQYRNNITTLVEDIKTGK